MRRAILWCLAPAALAAVIILWIKTPSLYASAPVSSRAGAIATTRAGLLTAAAGLVALLAALITVDESRRANRQTRERDRANREHELATFEQSRQAAADARERDQELLVETRRANHRQNFCELYVQAVAQLGSPVGKVRMGGIYALELLANDRPGDQQMIVELLSAFIRDESTSAERREAFSAGAHTPSRRPATDIRAAFSVLARLPLVKTVARADLDGADLTGVASLSGIRLANADLQNVDLSGADLRHAVLDNINLCGVNLRNANLFLARVESSVLARADLRGADLTATSLKSSNVTGAMFSGTVLSESGKPIRAQAILHAAQLSETIGLTQEQLNGALGNRGDTHYTQIPTGLKFPSTWGDHDNEVRRKGGIF
jgi:uncharacterized protein YjbI with pentapeptide repeats